MVVICILAIIICLVLWCRVSYQKHCIEDLEVRISRIRKLQVDEIIDLLEDLKNIQNGNYERAFKDTFMRNTINENIEKYISKKQNLSTKNELNIRFERDNV